MSLFALKKYSGRTSVLGCDHEATTLLRLVSQSSASTKGSKELAEDRIDVVRKAHHS